MFKKVFTIVLLSVLAPVCFAQSPRDHWVDSVFNKLGMREKAAQIFMVQVDPSPASSAHALDLVKDGVGGVYIIDGGPIRHARLVNKLQDAAKSPLLVCMSAEWGGHTLDSIAALPKAMIMGAQPSDSLVVAWARALAHQLRDLGIHLNFAPNADSEIFSGDYLRYFSDQDSLVGRLGAVFVKALQEEGIVAVAKHLPRRWSTERPLPDSMIVLNLRQIDTTKLSAFQRIIQSGIGGIATDYMHFSLQNEQGIVPASVSQVFVSDVLRKMLGFQGMVFSDAHVIQKRMGKVKAGEAELLAFQSGADVIFPANASDGIKKVMREARRNPVLAKQLEESVKKILRTKYDAGLHHYTPVNTDNLVRRLNDPEYKRITDEVSASAVTVLQNSDSLLPIRTLEDREFVLVMIGERAGNNFERMLTKYAPFTVHHVRQPSDTAQLQIKPGAMVIVGVNRFAGALEKSLKAWLNQLGSKHASTLVHFGNPGALKEYTSFRALIAAYTDEDGMPSASAQVIFGGIGAKGKLPLAIGDWAIGTSVKTASLGRLTYGTPESVGVSSHKLDKIRAIMEEAIATGATPGCQTLVIKNGKVFYAESAGHLTYEKKIPVTEETIYDLASVTKISATLQTVLFMHDRGLIDINKKASVYLPELKNSNKADFTIKDILTHQAGLWPFLPFWVQTMKENQWMPEYYNDSLSADYPFEVSEKLYASRAMKDSLWQWIVKARIREKPVRTPYDYRYSDMGFYILQHLAEKLLNQPMEDFLDQNLYDPLGAYTTGYLPRRRFQRDRIAPTEQDTLFRKSLLVGYVHDQGAAMHGGIAGHAGLFSTANDLAKVGQMWLQKGTYGGVRYFKPETIELFATQQYSDSRRGLGWDKPMPSDWTSPTAFYSSTKTFGHTGFTGTCIWVDPTFDLVYIFLSNRVMPDMNNNKLLSTNVRPRIQQVIYEAIFDYRASGK